jgi:hypothetical protein
LDRLALPFNRKLKLRPFAELPQGTPGPKYPKDVGIAVVTKYLTGEADFQAEEGMVSSPERVVIKV